ncbi:probable beta-1,4-xylosyltransferase IRX9L isoform X1 [Zingiber officinale]|uniref:probable beta-1,4-xylosyltransferase IRX9L isoform X1 n=2 Tax=Zingiber officinale TaxID=94328 RepID=UPI001C4CC7AE|nr:probable beta-1,4-xylosyltransferase IRX9L isoform X1 [Zingiber officinale]
MASIRRNITALQRGGDLHYGDEILDSSISDKLSHSDFTYVSGRSLLKRLLTSLSSRIPDRFTSLLLRPTSRLVDRSKAKGVRWKKLLFRIALFFSVGLFIGFTPFFAVDISEDLSQRRQDFSFPEDHANAESHKNINTARKEAAEELDKVKLLIVITPTYVRPLQVYHLNRLAHTLANVSPPLLWLVVEKFQRSDETARILRGSRIIYRHLVCKRNVTNQRDACLNTALSHIEEHHLDGIVHFADENVIYSIHLFDQMRQIRRFGTWPVAVVTAAQKQLVLEGPVCNGSQVIGWHKNRGKLTRRSHSFTAGFAFNSTLLWEPNRWVRINPAPKRKHGLIEEDSEETAFVEELFEDKAQMQGLANNCSSIMAWRLEIEAPRVLHPKGCAH